MDGTNPFTLFYQTQVRESLIPVRFEGGLHSFILLCIAVNTQNMNNFFKPFLQDYLRCQVN